MGVEIAVDVVLTEINCGECGGTYAINQRYHDQKRQKGGYWTCPYCQCGWGFGESEIDRQKKALEKERKRREWAEQSAARAREQAEAAERRRKAQKAATTRLRNRAKAGLCPCCNRHFKQLSAHMKSQHPEFVGEADDV